MKNLEKLGFKNVENYSVITPEKCCKHNKDKKIILEEYNEERLLNLGVDTLFKYDEKGAALFLMNNEESKAIYPVSVLDKNESGYSIAASFKDNKDLINNSGMEAYKLDVIERFENIINEHDLKTILVLEQNKNNELIFDFVY